MASLRLDPLPPSLGQAANSPALEGLNEHLPTARTRKFVAIGQPNGSLLIQAMRDGKMLSIPLVASPVKQMLVCTPSLRAHADENESGWLLSLHQDGGVVCLRLVDIVAELLRQEGQRSGIDGAHVRIIPFTKLNLVGARGISSLCCVRPLRSPLFEDTWDPGVRHNPGISLLVAARSPPLALYHIDIDSEQRSLGELAVAAAAKLGTAVKGIARDVSAVLPAPVSSGLRRLGGGLLALGSSTLSGYLPAALIESTPPATGTPVVVTPGGGNSNNNRADSDAMRLAALRGAHGRSATMDGELQDEGRVITHMVADPTQRLVLATDKIGRVLLLDAADLTILRLWKGYRDCEIAWLSSDEAAAAASDSAAAGSSSRLFCVLFSRRRKQVELWPAGPFGARVAALKIPHAEWCALAPELSSAAFVNAQVDEFRRLGRCFIVVSEASTEQADTASTPSSAALSPSIGGDSAPSGDESDRSANIAAADSSRAPGPSPSDVHFVEANNEEAAQVESPHPSDNPLVSASTHHVSPSAAGSGHQSSNTAQVPVETTSAQDASHPASAPDSAELPVLADRRPGTFELKVAWYRISKCRTMTSICEY